MTDRKQALTDLLAKVEAGKCRCKMSDREHLATIDQPKEQDDEQ